MNDTQTKTHNWCAVFDRSGCPLGGFDNRDEATKYRNDYNRQMPRANATVREFPTREAMHDAMENAPC